MLKTRTCEAATAAKPPANSAPSSIQPRAHPAPTAPTESPAPKDRHRRSSLLHGHRTAQVVCSTPAATILLRRVLRYYRCCAMQCPHHSSRLCPAHRSRPRPDHQPCPPPSPCESHPRHRAAPAVFQTSAASCGAKALPARGPNCPHRQSARSARKQFDSNPVHGRGTQRRPSARPPRLPPRRAKRTLPSAATPPPERMARVAREAYRARALSGAPSRSPASGGTFSASHATARPAPPSPSPSTTRKRCSRREGCRYRTAPPRALTHSFASCIGHSGLMKNAGLSAL